MIANYDQEIEKRAHPENFIPVCECEEQGLPRSSDGNCDKCGYELMDEEDHD